MRVNKFDKKATIGTAVFSAVTLKLCCWGPLLLTSVAGVSGSSAYFSWLETLKPYLLTLAFLSLGFAFYQVYKPNKTEACSANCKTEKTSFFKSKLYVWLVAVFVVFMTAVSYYPQLFHQANNKSFVIVDKSNIQSVKLNIEGMTCAGCESHVIHVAYEVEGVLDAEADHETGKAVVKFDKSITSAEDIIKSIDAASYKVKKHEILKE